MPESAVDRAAFTARPSRPNRMLRGKRRTRFKTWTFGRGTSRQVYVLMPRLTVSLKLIWRPRVRHGKRAAGEFVFIEPVDKEELIARCSRLLGVEVVDAEIRDGVIHEDESRSMAEALYEVLTTRELEP